MKRPIAAVLTLGAILACAPAQSNTDTGTSASTATVDTLSGMVAEVGSDPGTWMSLRPASGGQPLRLGGDAVTALRAVSNTEIWVSGTRQVDEFRVDRFIVRKANGNPVDDGIVVVEQGKTFLRFWDGSRREIPHAPPQLVAMPGARIWITKPAENQTPTYGVIVQKP